MNILNKINLALENAEMMGMYAIQTDHPGLMKNIKKKKTNKVDRSLFMNDKNAKKQHIFGTLGSDGKKKTNKVYNVESKIDKRLEQ